MVPGAVFGLEFFVAELAVNGAFHWMLSCYHFEPCHGAGERFSPRPPDVSRLANSGIKVKLSSGFVPMRVRTFPIPISELCAMTWLEVLITTAH